MTSVTHHTAVRVSDIERAAAFYIEALDGKFLTLPRRAEGPTAELVMGGPPGTAFASCRIGFDSGCVELFEFTGPELPEWATRPVGRVPHFGVLVANVMETLARVEQAGGSRLWPEVEHWGPATTMYACDPDGNVFELADMPLEELVAVLIEMFPESDPKNRSVKGRKEPT